MIIVLRKSGTYMGLLNRQTTKNSLRRTRLKDPRIVQLFLIVVPVATMIGERLRFMEQRKLTDTLESKAKFPHLQEIIA